MTDVFPVIQSDTNIPSAKNIAFGNLKPLIHGNFVDAKPDSYNRARPEQIDRRVRKELGPYIIPSIQGQAPILANSFIEVKGPEGSGAVAKRQACHNGVLGERAVREMTIFGVDGSEMVCDNNAHTITSTYHSATGTLQMYAIHQTQPRYPEDPPEYHMTQLGGWVLTGSVGQFRDGTSAFRNGRDWAKTGRYELIAAANGRAAGVLKETSVLGPSAHSISQSTMEPDAPESETSADELPQDGS